MCYVFYSDSQHLWRHPPFRQLEKVQSEREAPCRVVGTSPVDSHCPSSASPPPMSGFVCVREMHV